MPDTTSQITDSTLTEAIKASHLREDQKKDLTELLPQMTSGERQELIKIISDSNTAAKKFEEDKMVKLGKLNEEYEERMKETAKEESDYLRKETEEFDEQIEREEMQGMEEEMAENDLKEQEEKRKNSAKAQVNMLDTKKENKQKNKTLRNTILISLGVILIILIILIIINSI